MKQENHMRLIFYAVLVTATMHACSRGRMASTPTPLVIVVTATAEPSATSPATSSTFGPITFAPGVTGSTPDVRPIDTATKYPEGVVRICAVYPYTGALKGIQWRNEVSIDGVLEPDFSTPGWDLTGHGTTRDCLWSEDGLQTGEYKYRLYVMEKLVQSNSFSIDKRQSGDPFIGPIRFAEGMKDNEPVNVHKPDESFAGGIKEVYAVLDARNMADGLKYSWEWYLDGVLSKDHVGNDTWKGPETYRNFWFLIQDDLGLVSGSRELKLYIGGKLVQLGTFVTER